MSTLPPGGLPSSTRRATTPFARASLIFPSESYPDEGASVECWTTGHGETVGGLDFGKLNLFHVEAENPGPNAHDGPGRNTESGYRLVRRPLPRPHRQCDTGSCSHERLRADLVDAGIRLTGVFGLFHLGDVQLVCWMAMTTEFPPRRWPRRILSTCCESTACAARRPAHAPSNFASSIRQGQPGALLDRCSISTSSED